MTEGVRLVVDHNIHVRFDPGEVGDDEGVADLEGVLEQVELAVLVVAKLECGGHRNSQSISGPKNTKLSQCLIF